MLICWEISEIRCRKRQMCDWGKLASQKSREWGENAV